MTKVHTTNQQKKIDVYRCRSSSFFFCWFVVCTFVMKSLPLYPIVPTSFDDQNPHNLRTWSIFLQFCILRSSSLKAVMSKWMKGEAQANAMSVCVCATRQRRSHTGLLLSLLLLFACSSVLLVVCSVGDHREDEHVPQQSWLHIVDPLSSCSSSHTEWVSTLH